MDMEINEFVERFANQFVDYDMVNVKADVKFRDLDSWDSLTGMAVLTMIQDDFGVEINVDDFLKLSTPREVLEYINSKK
jgi:acyl carrier protein